MLDISFIKNEWENTTVFYPTNGIDWQTWNKPRGCKYIWIMAIGPGAGGLGGAGAGGAASAPGGGSGGVINALYPANVLPDTLYIRPGTGSLGATGSTVNGNPVSFTAARSWVTVAPTGSGATPDSMFTIATSGTTGASGNSGDTGITIANFFSHACLLGLATFTGTNGQAGTNASDTTAINGTITCAGGRGSASSITAGTSIAAINFTTYTTPTINGGIAGSGKGDDGIWNWRPLYGLGGAGGGGAAGGTAGTGGDGAYGCGGGGGGNNSAGTGGNGGKGGDGLVIIVSI